MLVVKHKSQKIVLHMVVITKHMTQALAAAQSIEAVLTSPLIKLLLFNHNISVACGQCVKHHAASSTLSMVWCAVLFTEITLFTITP